MKITHLERTAAVCVPFLPGILPSSEFEEYNEAYPESIGKRRQDVLEIHTDDGLVGIGMTMPYYGTPPAPPNDLIGKAIGWPLCRIFGGKLQNRLLVDYWISRMSPEDSANAAKLAASQGFHGIKMKCAAKGRECGRSNLCNPRGSA